MIAPVNPAVLWYFDVTILPPIIMTQSFNYELQGI